MQMQMQMQIVPSIGCCEAIKLAFKNFGKCSGRSRRSEYWYFQLLVFLILLPLYYMMIMMQPSYSSSSYDYDYNKTSSSFNLVCTLFGISALVLCIPQISVTVRRLHDTGKSGCFYFVTFIPFVGNFILLYLCSIDSEQGTNQYGPSPKYIVPDNAPLNPNNNAYVVPVNPYPQQNQMQPQVSPYPQPNQVQPQVNPYPQPMQPQVSPYPQPNQMAPQVNPYPQLNEMTPQANPYPQPEPIVAPVPQNPPPQGFSSY